MGWLRSIATDWRKFRGLPRPQQGLLVKAMLLLAVVVAGHRLFGVRRTQWTLNRFAPAAPTRRYSEQESIQRARFASRVVRIAAYHSIFPATCLQQSFLLHWLLAREGIVTDLRIGVRRRKEELEAHAWVEYLGLAVNEGENVSARFSPFPRRVLDPEAGGP